MKRFLKDLLDPGARKAIEYTHSEQSNMYGVYAPPSLKQLISLRHLLLRTGTARDIKSEDLLGLSRIECQMLLKVLHKIYLAQQRNRRSHNNRNGVEHVETASL